MLNIIQLWENLLKAIQDVTGLEEDDPVIQAWAKAYGVIADVFIQIEKKFMIK